MARLPDENDLGMSMPTSQQVVSGPREGIGSAVQRFGRTIESESEADRVVSRQQRAERDALDLTRARADWHTRRANEGNLYQYENDQDYATWKPRYEKHILKHRDSSAALIGNPRLRSRFEAEAQADIATDSLAIDNRARGIDRDRRVTEGLTSIDRQMGAAATMPRAEADKMIAQARASIDNMAATGLLTPAQAVEKRQRVVENYAITKWQRFVDEDPAAALQALSGKPGDSYYDKLRQRESSGNDNAKAATSSALGRYQITDGTWADLRKNHPELGLSVDGRKDPIQQEKAIRAFTQDNADYLRKNGIPSNEANLYLAHFMGRGGAVELLKAAPGANAASLFPEAAEANPSIFYGKMGPRSVAEVTAALTNGFSKSGGIADETLEFLPPEARVRLASAAETGVGQINQRVAEQQRQDEANFRIAAKQRKDELDLGIEQGGVSQELILNDPIIDDGDKATLLRRWNQREDENASASGVWQAIQNGEPLPDKSDKGLDGIFKGVGGAAALAKNEPNAVATVAYLWDKAQAIPPTAKRTITGMIRSGSQESMISGLAILDQLQRQNPVAFDKEFDDDTAKALTYYQDRIGASPEDIFKGLRDRADPAIVKAREPLVTKGTKEAIEKYDADKIAGMFDQSYLPFTAPGVVEGSVKGKILDSALIEQDFARAYGDAYADDPANAEKNGLSMIQRKWGISPTNGGKVMRYPPERYTPDIPGEPNWRTEVLENALRKLGYTVEQSAWVTEAQKRNKDRPGWEPKPDPLRNYVIQPIPMTESDIAAHVSPHYAIIIQNPKTGEWDAALDKDGVPVAFQWTAEDAKPFQDRADRKFRSENDAEMARKTRTRKMMDDEGAMRAPPIEELQ